MLVMEVISSVKLCNSPAIRSGFLKISKPKGFPTRLLSSNPNELSDSLKLLLQEKQAGNSSDILNEEIMAIADRLLEKNAYLQNGTKLY